MPARYLGRTRIKRTRKDGAPYVQFHFKLEDGQKATISVALTTTMHLMQLREIVAALRGEDRMALEGSPLRLEGWLNRMLTHRRGCAVELEQDGVYRPTRFDGTDRVITRWRVVGGG